MRDEVMNTHKPAREVGRRIALSVPRRVMCDLLAFARALDEGPGQMAVAWGVAPEGLRRLLHARCRDESDPRRWAEESAVRPQLRGWHDAACRAIDALAAGAVRASSLVENLNSRLRTYFSLRRHLGPDYLELLRFYLNHQSWSGLNERSAAARHRRSC